MDSMTYQINYRYQFNGFRCQGQLKSVNQFIHYHYQVNDSDHGEAKLKSCNQCIQCHNQLNNCDCKSNLKSYNECISMMDRLN